MNNMITTDALVKRLNRHFKCQYLNNPKKFNVLRVYSTRGLSGWLFLNFSNQRFGICEQIDGLAGRARTEGVLADDERVEGETPLCDEHPLVFLKDQRVPA